MSSDLLEDTRIVTSDTGDHDKFSHYVKKEDILAARVEGKPCIALCGKEWIPNDDENKYSVCPTCKSIWESMA